MQGRRLCMISLLIVLVLIFSAYGPWDYLGLYAKSKAVEDYLVEGESVVATGQVYHKEIKNDQTVYYVKQATVYSKQGCLSKTSFSFKIDSDSIPLKSKIKISGNIKKFAHPRNEGEFDLKNYYNSLGIFFQLDNPEIKEATTGFDYIYQINKRINQVLSYVLPEKEAGFISSVTIGNKTNLDKDMRTDFSGAGLAHILAVSGLHVSVVCMGIYRLLRRVGISFRKSGVIAGLIAVFYGLLTGASLSSIRAIGMFLLYLLAQVLGENYDMLTATALMAMFLLAGNPLYIINTSFQLSFGAVLGIWFIALPLCRKFQIKTKSKLLNYFTNSLVFSIGITIAMLPFTTQIYYEYPTYGVLLNLLVLPFMPMLLGISLIGGIVCLFNSWAAGIILYPCYLIVVFYEKIIELFLKLPFSKIIVGHHDFYKIVIYYLAVLILIKLSNRLEVKPSRLVLGITVAALFWSMPDKQVFQVDILDVGQGDGIYITSEDGVNYFIDGGSTSKEKVGEYTLLPFLKYKGTRKIDYWFVSHTDDDHVSGLIELLDSGYKIENIVFTDCIPRANNEAFSEILELAEASGAHVLYMKEGDIIGSNNIRFECVYPGGSVANLYSDDVNALSLSLLMSYDRNSDGTPEFTAFFGGDLAAEQEQIIASSGLVGHVDLLKVSHHGSRFSSDSAFLQTLSPDVAVISCAKHNLYGHPADEAVERLEKAGALIYYTMNSGRVRLDGAGVDLLLHE